MLIKRKILIWGSTIILLILSINPAPLIAQSSFSDDFNGSSINSTWSQYNDPGVSVVQTNGVIYPKISSLGNSWEGTYLYKSISSSVTRIDMDYSFNFDNGMGRLYLIGKDPTNTKIRWIIGETDGWAATNAKPIIFIFNPDGGPNSINSSASWNKLDVNSEKSINTGGNGHITVQFISDTLISVDFTFTKTIIGVTSESNTFQTAGSTGVIQLVFDIAPSTYYQQSECMKIDNYQENNVNPTLKMSSYCSINSSTTDFQKNPAVATTSTNAIPPIVNNNSNVPLLIILGIIFICIIGAIVILANYNRNKNLPRYSNNPNRVNNSNKWYYSRAVNNNSVNISKANILICPTCSAKVKMEDIFCEQCGSRLH